MKLKKHDEDDKNSLINEMNERICDMQNQIKIIEGIINKDAIKLRVSRQCKMIINSIEETKIKILKLDDKRRVLENRLSKIKSSNLKVLTEEKSIMIQIESIDSY